MEDGVPVAPAPMGSERGSAAAAGRVACCWSPGGAIEPEVLSSPDRALGADAPAVVPSRNRYNRPKSPHEELKMVKPHRGKSEGPHL